MKLIVKWIPYLSVQCRFRETLQRLNSLVTLWLHYTCLWTNMGTLEIHQNLGMAEVTRPI